MLDASTRRARPSEAAPCAARAQPASPLPRRPSHRNRTEDVRMHGPSPTSTASSSNGATACSTRATGSSGRAASRSCGTPRQRQRAQAIRQRIEATVVRRAPQVMVKVTGGGRGMKAIAAHLRYISKNGRLEIEDDRARRCAARRSARAGRRLALRRLAYRRDSPRREAFNVILSMPRGTDPQMVLRAAREFAQHDLRVGAAWHRQHDVEGLAAGLVSSINEPP